MVHLWLTTLVTTFSQVLGLRPAEPSVPLRNVRVDERLGRVTWDLAGPVDEITCSMTSMNSLKAQNNNTFCQINALSFCKTTNYTVTVTVPRGRPFSTWVQYPQPGGDPGAAAANLTCWVHQVDIVECSWAVGPAAPRDVQYHLLLHQPRTYKEWACRDYSSDSRGVHTGCRFQGITALGNLLSHFVVTAGSASSAHMPCAEIFASPSDIERLSAPRVSQRCEESRSIVEWKMVSNFSWDWIFELEIQKGRNPAHTERVPVGNKNCYELVNPGAYSLRMRVRNRLAAVGVPGSSWSPAQRFECPEDQSLVAWHMVVSGALGMLLLGAVATMLCRRFSVLQKLFPPIPRMTDPLGNFLQDERLVAWEADFGSWEDCPVEQVLAAGETCTPGVQQDPHTLRSPLPHPTTHTANPSPTSCRGALVTGMSPITGD